MSDIKTNAITAGAIATLVAGCYLSYCVLTKTDEELTGAQ